MQTSPALQQSSAAPLSPLAAPPAVRSEKAASAYRTISEAAELLGVPQHVLRFWETKFPQLSPMKRSGGRRYYRPQDLSLLKTIQHLLHAQGYTIKGAQRLLKAKRGSNDMPAMDAEALALARQAGTQFGAEDALDALDALVGGIGAAASDVIAALQPDESDAAIDLNLLDLIPSHLPAKPAALMAFGLETGRLPASDTILAPVAALPSQLDNPSGAGQAARLSLLLDELAALKAELL